LGASVTYWREGKCIHDFGWGNLKARDHLEKLEVHERIALT
jgi:hypothetical protein